MAQQSRDAVLAKIVRIVQQELVVDGLGGVGVLIDRTAHTGILTIESIVESRTVGVVDVQTKVVVERQAVVDVKLCTPTSAEDISRIFVLIQLTTAGRVRATHKCTVTGIVGQAFTITIVIHGEAVAILHDIAIGIAHIEGIDRRHEVGNIENVG